MKQWVSPPQKTPPSPRQPTVSSYSLPPHAQRLFDRQTQQQKIQAQTVSQTTSLPPATNKKLTPAEIKLAELDASAAAALKIQSAFKGSPGFAKFSRQSETRKRIEELYGGFNTEGLGEKQKVNGEYGNNGNEEDESMDEEESGSRRGGGGRRRQKRGGGRSRNKRGRGKSKNRRGDNYSDDSSDYSEGSDDSYNSEESDDSYDSYDDRSSRSRRRGGGRNRRKHKRSSSRRRHGRDHRDNRDRHRRKGRSRRDDDSQSEDYSEDNDDEVDTKRRGKRRNGQDRGGKSGKSSKSSKSSKSKDRRNETNKMQNNKNNSKKKTPKQTLQEKMGMAATRIQAFVRTRLAILRWEHTMYPALMRFQQQTLIVADNMVAELLEDEVIPDVRSKLKII